MQAPNEQAEIVTEIVPIEGGDVHGVTFDGALVWYACGAEIVAFDPEAKAIVRRLVVPAEAGTAFDGEHLYQLAGDQIVVVRPADGRVVRTIAAPGKGHSGMAYADGHLWLGEYRAGKIHKVDAKTGEVKKTLSSDRFVTGVSVVDGDLWHGASEEGPAQLRRLADDGTVQEILELPGGNVRISGVESDRRGGFWCGGEGGTLRNVRKRRAAG
jgi:outer membrane protein assembly factor BamB